MAPLYGRARGRRGLRRVPVLLGRAPAVLAQTSGDVVVKSPQAILMDADTGAIMFQRNADELVSPASMSKLMLLAVVFKALQSRRGQAQRRVPDERVRLAQGRRAVRHVGDVRAGRHEGEKVEELIKGIIVQSGNDAAIAVAENIGGSEAAVRQAHDGRGAPDRPQEVGLQELRPGLYHPEHQMTVRELAMLARHIIRTYPEYYPLFAMREYQLPQAQVHQPQPAARPRRRASTA